MTEKLGDALIDFALRWAPFGGPNDDDLLVEFGMTSRTYYNRLARALRVRPPAEVGEDIHRALLALCYRPHTTSYESEPSHMT
ncbi:MULTISPECIES: hypothetical protein [Rhodococcus]|uniref:DUF3263 domain-containing protein n=2 Tax=Rhodococcus TaxID=1827 RepID=X0RCV2_RHOWR|nr:MULTISPECIES: hypothetical protein [Rhodococcus]AII08245.1 hypothetical protein EP51_27925 [Rhodococcus opacus]GAF48875.1 hypothetical protein RW1_061_00370 [Rhodococcus wratislaviensis NBRC 100605]